MINTMRVNQLVTEIANDMPWLSGISSHDEYLELNSLLGELVEDYESNKLLIELLFPVIERYEASAPEFAEFNERVNAQDQGVAMLRVLIDQNGLTLSDFPEVGGKSLLSLILKGERSLTVNHIKALSNRFGVPAMMFF